MLQARRICGTLLSAALFALSSFSPAATSIAYQAIDLTDTTLGEDRWQYSYTVSGGFPQFFGFEVAFDGLKVASLDAPVAPDPDWFAATVKPLPGVPADGTYSAMALASNASLASPFHVTFVWNGPGVPGAQSFNILDDTFGQIDTGTTVPIPEPHAYGLMGAGLLLLIARLHTRCAR